MVLYHAPRTGAGKDRTDPAILLEVYERIRDREDCGTVILGSGDADYQVPAEDDAAIDDVLERFVREMDRLEGRLNFLGYSMLCNQWMLDWGIGWNEYECRRLVDEYQPAGIVERHEVINQSNLDRPTSAIRLVCTDATVRRALGFSEGPAILCW